MAYNLPMNKQKLIGFFRTEAKIGEIVGITKQSVHIVTDFKKVEYIRLIEKELDKRYKALTRDYESLKEDAKRIKQDHKRKQKG